MLLTGTVLVRTITRVYLSIQAIVFALRAFDALWDIHVLNLAAMYVISQLLLAVPVMCESIRVYDSPSVDVLKGEVCAAGMARFFFISMLTLALTCV